jgi:hypothetical protein
VLGVVAGETVRPLPHATTNEGPHDTADSVERARTYAVRDVNNAGVARAQSSDR